MKHPLLLSLAVAGLILSTPGLHAAPLDRAQVAADARWLLHLDVEALLKSQLGNSLMKSVVAEAGEGLKKDAGLDLSKILRNTTSIMAYGTDFNSGKDGKGVLVWQGSKEIEQIAGGFLVQQAEAAKAGGGNVKLVRTGDQPVYAFGEDMHVMVRPGGGLILSRAVDQIDAATKVMESKAPSLKDKPTFSGYAALPGGFFFLALADGFNKVADIPPQANVLKLADGMRLALGESGEKFKAQLTLNAPSEEVAKQIKALVSGLLMLTTVSNHDLDGDFMLQVARQLTSEEAIKVTGKQLVLNLEVPIEALQKEIDKHLRGKVSP
jgi:hypothetical protein